MLRKLINSPFLYLRSLLSIRKAVELDDIGKMFNYFGRQFGWKLLRQKVRSGFSYLINPVSSFRYFEFPFVLSVLADNPGYCLDVSSPRLFSFYVAEKKHPSSIWMINPDQEDMQLSAAIARRLGVSSIKVDSFDVSILEGFRDFFDTIWSISVIEHISGEYDDRYAVRKMYAALKPGGRLILTVPVDRFDWDEYRDENYYSIQKEKEGLKGYFFQRHYDRAAIWERLVYAIGDEPSTVRWFGEKKAGHFSEYEKRWLREGNKVTVDDPVDFSENYREYSSWEGMPGRGVCGLVFEKPCEDLVEYEN
ncbi:MAG: class I SAM-dependent methyltransferase [Deltaproteobacteria bacterium]|nr:class I SAM-dependent methyltransferase [Deltaproteobacteria bacterium]